MQISKEIRKLNELGTLPNHDENVEDHIIDQFEELLSSVQTPINLEEAKILVKLFPLESCFGIEWTLLHLLESVFKETDYESYKEVIMQCNNERWKKILLDRLEQSSA